MAQVEFRPERVELADGADGKALLRVSGAWVADAIRSVEGPELVVEAGGTCARAQPYDGSAAALAGPIPERWSGAYTVDPSIVRGASLRLVTADGASYRVPAPECGTPEHPSGGPLDAPDATDAPAFHWPAPGEDASVRLEALYRATVASAPAPSSDPIFWRGAEIHSGPVLDVSGLRKAYGDVVALDGVDVQVSPGEILALVGPSGAGKTTFASVVSGVLAPDSGSVRIAGVDACTDALEAHRLLGAVPQKLALYPALSARRNLAFAGELMGLHRRALDARIEDVAAAVGLTGLLDRDVRSLCGGEKRRVQTAMAMLHRPPLLLLDEPTADADIATRTHLLLALKALAAEGTAICCTTRYPHEVETLGASVALLARGRIVARGAMTDLVAEWGRPLVEVRFRGAVPPELRQLGTVDEDERLLTIQAAGTGSALASAVGSIGRRGDEVASIQVLEPSLETVYLAVTGQRFDDRGTDDAA